MIESVGTTIVESYRDFHPPRNFRKTVETLLKYVPAKYLVGLKTVVLTNQAAFARDKQKQKVWSRKRKLRLADLRGSYTRAWQSSPAVVWLYVDNIISAEDWWWKWVPLYRYIFVSDVLYHEIGHHIHTVHKPIYDEREDVAEDWRKKLFALFVRKHYWYWLPVLYPVALVSKVFPKWDGIRPKF